MSPKVSVILCCYNQAAFVEKAIESVLAQTYRDFELIVVDNGSTDGSAEIIRKFETHPQVKFVPCPENVAVTRRLNQGIRLCSGEFISLLYADDLYLEEKLEKQIAAFSKLGPEYGVVYTPGYRHNLLTGEKWQEKILTASGFILREMFEHAMAGGVMHPVSPLVRRECYERFPFKEEFFIEGELHYLRLAMAYKFFFLETPTVVMQEHAENKGKTFKKNLEIITVFLEKLKEEKEFPKELLPALKSYQSELFAYFGWLGLRVARDQKWAKQCYRSATRLKPAICLKPKVVLGLVLAEIPQELFHQVNQLSYRLRKQKMVPTYRDNYA